MYREGGNMDLSKLSLIFKFVILGIFYIIIFFALKIMYKDIKNNGRQKPRKHTLGLEIIEPGNSINLKRGGVIPIHGEISLGRRQDNLFILDDQFVSGHHARIYQLNDNYILEDLNSTNGTLLNNLRIKGKTGIVTGDIIKVGSTVLKVIG